MNASDIDVQALVNNPSSVFRTFDHQTFDSFKSVWETRLIEAREIHHRSDLGDKAEEIIDFMSGPPADLRLHLFADKNLSFLYRISSKDFLIITDSPLA